MNGKKVATRPVEMFGCVQSLVTAFATLSASSFQVLPVCPGIQSMFVFVPL